MTNNTDVHTCSYYCERPECIKRQRDEMRDRMAAAIAQQPAAAMGEEIMVNAAHGVYTLPLQPSWLLSGPRFVVYVPLIEAPAVKALQAEIEGLREQLRLSTVDQATAEAEANDARAENKRLAKALSAYQAAVNKIDDLIEYSLPMPPETKAALYAILDDLTEELAKENKA